MTDTKKYKCTTLVATKNRWELLSKRALPSIRNQTFLPDQVVLVNDGHPFNHNQILELKSIMGNIPVKLLSNNKSSGAAGAWNTGLEYLRKSSFHGYVAILDDDDEWDFNHLQLNIAKATETDADLIVSGLRRVASGKISKRSINPIYKSIKSSSIIQAMKNKTMEYCKNGIKIKTLKSRA